MTSRKRSKKGGDGGTGVHMREGTTLRVMVTDRPYGEFYDFYVSPEYFGYSLLRPPRLTWEALYHDFLRNVLPKLLQDVDLQGRHLLWFMHYCASPHFLLAFLEFWNNGCEDMDQ
jgi:hypothetical protein